MENIPHPWETSLLMCVLSQGEGKTGERGKTERTGVENRRVGRGRCKGLCVCVGACVWRRSCGRWGEARIEAERGGREAEWECWEENGERFGWRLMQVGGTIWWLIGSEIRRQLAKVKAASDGVLLISGSMCWCMCNPCWQTKQAFLLMPQSAGSNLKSASLATKTTRRNWPESGDKSTSIPLDPPSVCNSQACTSTGEATCGWLDVCPYYSRDWCVETLAISAR